MIESTQKRIDSLIQPELRYIFYFSSQLMTDVLVRNVIRYQIQQDSQHQRLGSDFREVGNVVAKIFLGTFVDGRDNHRADTLL